MRNTGKFLTGIIFIMAFFYCTWVYSIIADRLDINGAVYNTSEYKDLSESEAGGVDSEPGENNESSEEYDSDDVGSFGDTDNMGEAVNAESEHEIVLTVDEIEEFISDEIKDKYSVYDISVVCNNDGGVAFSFEAGTIPGLEYISKQRITVNGVFENPPDKENPYYNIETIYIGGLKVPELFVRQAEEYFNDVLSQELERRFGNPIETAYVSANGIRIKVSEE